jgi:hypothetical protein
MGTLDHETFLPPFFILNLDHLSPLYTNIAFQDIWAWLSGQTAELLGNEHEAGQRKPAKETQK